MSRSARGLDRTIRKDSCEKLKFEIQKYRRSRETLVKCAIDTMNKFDNLRNIVSSKEIVDCFETQDLEDVALHLGAKGGSVKNCDLENPALAIMGQVKSGKSTLINVILRRDTVPQSYDRCTARVIRLFYNKTNYISIIDKDGQVEMTKRLWKGKIAKKYVKLKGEFRRNSDEASKIVFAGLSLNFLECGIDLIDTPGFSENNILTDISKRIIKDYLPVIIYVINGSNSLTQTDVSDLLEIRNEMPNLEIIYFVTHLDNADSSDNSIQDVHSFADEKMDSVFQKLKYNNFIEKTYSQWQEYPLIKGASLNKFIAYMSARDSSENEFHYQRFCSFEITLHQELVNNFKNKISKACQRLMNFHMDIITKLILYAENIALKTHENLKEIQNIKSTEEKLFLRIKSAISETKNDFKDRLIVRLQEETESIINPIKDLEYPSYLEIPQEGMTCNGKIIEECQNMIIKALIQGLEDVIKGFVREELFEKYKTALDRKHLDLIKEKLLSNSKNKNENYRILLERKMSRFYEEDRFLLTKEKDKETLINFINVILGTIKQYLSSMDINVSESRNRDVNSQSWKLEQAKEYLKYCNTHLLAEDVCNKLLEDFQENHKNFLAAMDAELSFIKQKFIECEDKKLKLTESAPEFFMLFLEAYEINCKYRLDRVQRKQLIGESSRGKLYYSILSRKMMTETLINVDDEKAMMSIAEEVYYSSQFSYERLLPIVGVLFDEDKKHVSIYHAAMETTLSNYLKKNIVRLKTGLDIALQIADGIKYLHDHEIIYRYLNLSNIFMDTDKNIRLSCFGYCKSIALIRFDLSNSFRMSSGCSLSLETAPELKCGGLYTKMVDIYSLGIVMWYIFGDMDRCLRSSAAKIKTRQTWHGKAPLVQTKPERISKIPDQLWSFLESCWTTNAFDRPNINEVIKFLKNFQESYFVVNRW